MVDDTDERFQDCNQGCLLGVWDSALGCASEIMVNLSQDGSNMHLAVIWASPIVSSPCVGTKHAIITQDLLCALGTGSGHI